ncbi:MAG: hypothetical protein PHO25_03910 [Syntrophomonadaceae bacterium]|nr:hypothetical protein [Syntrophomonadaceae bacterium]
MLRKKAEIDRIVTRRYQMLDVTTEPLIPQSRATVTSGISDEAEEEVLSALNEWVVSLSLSRGQMAYDYTNAETGEQQALFDLAWPDGLQEGLSQPVVVLLNESSEILALASSAGFRY